MVIDDLGLVRGTDCLGDRDIFERGNSMNQLQALELLGLSHGASPEELKAAYRRKAMLHHPDKGGKQEHFILIKEAYDLLMKNGMGINKTAPTVRGESIWVWATIFSQVRPARHWSRKSGLDGRGCGFIIIDDFTPTGSNNTEVL